MGYVVDHINNIYDEFINISYDDNMKYIKDYFIENKEKYYNINVNKFRKNYNPFFAEILRLIMSYYSPILIIDEIIKKNKDTIDTDLYYSYMSYIVDLYDDKISNIDFINKIQRKILNSNSKTLNIIEINILKIIMEKFKHQLHIYNKPSLKETSRLEDEISVDKDEEKIILWKQKLQEVIDKENEIKKQIEDNDDESIINIIYDVDKYNYILYDDCK
jgi:hypothetical protein